MKKIALLLPVLTAFISINVLAQPVDLGADRLEAVGVKMSLQQLDKKTVVQVVKESSITAPDAPTFVKVKDYDFKDGIIVVEVLSKLRPDATPQARGFIGVAFRISGDNSKFECIYIRPANGRAEDQVRRNHSIQYFSFPDFTFDRLRRESPEKYESYADMGLNEWITMKVEVKGSQAKLYLNNNKQPSLVVNDLKLGADQSGGVGLFVDNGTEGYFSNLKISK